MGVLAIILLALFVLALGILVVIWATGANDTWRGNLVANYPIADLFWNVLRRATLSAVYGFGGGHAPVIATAWFAYFAIFAVLASPIIGFIHGLLVGLVILSMGRTARGRKSVLFYSVVTGIGTLVYAVGGYASMRVCLEKDYQSFDLAIFWGGIWGILGAIISGRLGHWIRQQTIAEN